jgi:hypothetical protein
MPGYGKPNLDKLWSVTAITKVEKLMPKEMTK